MAAIFSTAETWADVDAAWPAEPILRYIPGTDSGTFDYFVEEVFDEDPEPILAASNLELSEDDNVLVQGILGSPYAIGFFGYAYYQENADTLNVLSIEGVEASANRLMLVNIRWLARSSCTPMLASWQRNRRLLLTSTSS